MIKTCKLLALNSVDAIRNILLTPKNRKISVRADQGLIVLSKLHLCLPYRNHLKRFLGKNDHISFKTFVKKLRKVHIRCTKKYQCFNVINMYSFFLCKTVNLDFRSKQLIDFNSTTKKRK